MDKIFPKELKLYATHPSVKKSFISITEPTGALDCPNCGGTETFALFCAIKGPFQSPATPGAMEGEFYLTSHFDETIGRKGGWWVGITYTFPCPVCIGKEQQKPLQNYPVQERMKTLVHPNTDEVLESV